MPELNRELLLEVKAAFEVGGESAARQVIEEFKIRYVRSEAGVQRFGKPIGDPIGTDRGSAADLAHRGKLGGFTYDPRDKQYIQHGFAVAVHGHSRVVPLDKFDDTVVDNYIADNWHAMQSNPNIFFGGWYDSSSGDIFLDLSEVVDSKETAVRLGSERNEISVFDLDKLEEIPTGGSGDRSDTIGEAKSGDPAAPIPGRDDGAVQGPGQGGAAQADRLEEAVEHKLDDLGNGYIRLGGDRHTHLHPDGTYTSHSHAGASVELKSLAGQPHRHPVGTPGGMAHKELGKLALVPEVKADSGPVAAGLAVRAKDTGRVLLQQRAHKDKTAPGKWEAPGGVIDEGESPLDAARREFAEETGTDAPDVEPDDTWVSPNGVYVLHVVTVPRETDLSINGDSVDDDDGYAKTAAWFAPEDIPKMPALRDEARKMPWVKLLGKSTKGLLLSEVASTIDLDPLVGWVGIGG